MDFKKFYKHLYFDIDSNISSPLQSKQGDTDSRGFYITVLQDRTPVALTNETMTFFAEKPDDTRVFVNAVKENGIFRVDLTNQVFAAAGDVKCELVLKGNNGEKIASKTFIIRVARSLQEGSVISTNERGAIDEILTFSEEVLPTLQSIDVTAITNAIDDLNEALSSESARIASEIIRVANETNRIALYNDISGKLSRGELKGDIGPKGDKGEKGDKGAKGDTGEQGIQGSKGDTGDKGDKGEKGDKGDKGDTGEQGIQGSKGDTGDKGDKGEKGDKGDKGDTGSIENLTSSHVTTALGYNPISPTQLNSKVQTDVPSGAKFTDTITTINDKTGIIAKADIVALGIPASDTNTTYTEITTVEIDAGTSTTLRTITARRLKYLLDKIVALFPTKTSELTNDSGFLTSVTKSDVGLSNVDNVKQMPISGGVLENYSEKVTTISASGGSINLSLGNVFQHTPSGNITYSITNAVNGQAHSFTLIIHMGSTVRTLTFPASVKWQGGEIPDMSETNKTYVLTFVSVDGGTTWLGMFGGEF